MIIFGMISDLDHAFCSPYIFCTRSQRVAALVSQIQITVRRASLSTALALVLYLLAPITSYFSFFIYFIFFKGSIVMHCILLPSNILRVI